MCKRNRVDETKVHEMALDYLDNTFSKSEKAHDLYYTALQKSNRTAKKPEQNQKIHKNQTTNSGTIFRANFQLSLNKTMTSKQIHTDQVKIQCNKEQPYTLISAPL